MAQQPDEREVFRAAFDIRREQEKLGKHLSWKEAMKMARKQMANMEPSAPSAVHSRSASGAYR